jgi:hypothetical protein
MEAFQKPKRVRYISSATPTIGQKSPSRKSQPILQDLEQCGLLFIWSEDESHKAGYFTNIAGRLPSPADRIKMKKGPIPPQQQLEAYLAEHHISKETVAYLYSANSGEATQVREPRRSNKTAATQSVAERTQQMMQ